MSALDHQECAIMAYYLNNDIFYMIIHASQGLCLIGFLWLSISITSCRGFLSTSSLKETLKFLMSYLISWPAISFLSALHGPVFGRCKIFLRVQTRMDSSETLLRVVCFDKTSLHSGFNGSACTSVNAICLFVCISI